MMSGRCKKPVAMFASRAMDVLIPAEQTSGAFSLLHLSHPSGYWTQLLLHRNQDETLFVVSGSVRAETEAGSIDLLPGQALTLARGRPYRIGNLGNAAARLMSLRTSGRFDRLVRPAGQPASAADHLVGLRWEALRYGFELLDPRSVAMGAGAAPALAAPETLDVFGVSLQFLAELGTGDDDVSLMRGRFPPQIVVPLHSHADREVLYVLDGTLDISLGPVGQANWRTVERDHFVDVADGIPHALRNPGDVPVDILLVATRRIATLFREVGCPTAEAPAGPPSAARLAAFAQASQARGYWLGDGHDNAAIGLALA